MNLRPYQTECIDKIFEMFSVHPSTLVEMATGLGKAQPVDCLVLTVDGWVPMGLLTKDDLVIGSDGRGHRITGIYPQGIKTVYEVSFSDGSSTRCCKEHLWAVQTKSQKFDHAGFKTVSLESLFDDLRDGSGANKWFVPVVKPVCFTSKDVPLDPYAVGVLLGDGGLVHNMILTSADDFILQEMSRRVPDAQLCRVGKYDYTFGYKKRYGRSGSPLGNALRSLGMKGKGAEAKSIPPEYLFNDVETRLGVLRGLMDTDGHVTKRGRHSEFNTISSRLARDVCELVRSLGGCTRVRRRPPSRYTHNGEVRFGKPSYRITVSLRGINPFLMPRKAELANIDAIQGQTRAIVGIKRVGRSLCQCISVSAPDHLYVTDDYILTHNTVVLSHLARRWPTGRVLVMAHRDELIRQAAEKLTVITGEEPGIEMGEETCTNVLQPPRVVVTSVQTMSRPKRLARFDPAEFGLIITDECHHSVAGSYGIVYSHFQQNAAMRHLGVTATPKRADELAMGQVFESVAYRYGIEAAVADGWLVPVQQQVVKVEGLDFSKVKKLAGDLSEAELERIFVDEKMLHAVARPTIDLAGDRPALVFCINVNHAKLICAVLNRYKPGCAAWLSGETDRDERRRVVQSYKDGTLQVLCNCALFLEGFDAPVTSLVVMARPTLSIVVYTQVLGRGTRSLPGLIDGLETAEERKAAIAASGKPYMTVLDFVGNSGRHQIIQAADVLGGKWGLPIRQYAKQLAEEEPEKPAPVAELLERAADELAFLEEERELERRRAIKAEVAYRTQAVSPFGGAAPAAESQGSQAAPGETATNKQRGLLYHLGVGWETSARYSKRQASAVIDKLMAKRKQEQAG